MKSYIYKGLLPAVWVVTLILCALSSCGMIQIGGLTSGYQSLTDRQKQQVKALSSSMDAITDRGYVYKVSVQQVQDYIQKKKDVLIYNFTPWCSGDNCINPIMLNKLCEQNGVTLCVIANAYDDLFRYNLNTLQYFVIDEQSCGTKKRNKYIRVFFDALTQVEEKVRGYGSYLLFRDGVFRHAYEDIATLEKELQHW